MLRDRFETDYVKFIEKLRTRWQTSQSMLCVGIDPDPRKLPDGLRPQPGSEPEVVCEAIAAFGIALLDATAQYACAFKPQIAYFHAARAEVALEKIIAHAREHYRDIPLILDAKRGDIGATAEQYAQEAFERYQADAITLSPFMGFDSIEPYLRYRDKGAIVLCRTSNPGGDDFQNLNIVSTPLNTQQSTSLATPAIPQKDSPQSERLFERIARLANAEWNKDEQICLVVGATYPAELAQVRALAPKIPLLVPGIGAQGGDVLATVRAGRDASGFGMMINSSRAIIYASAGRDFAEAAALAAKQTRDQIRAAASQA
jgi:orotidine-5'-phosphate decarboxylase